MSKLGGRLVVARAAAASAHVALRFWRPMAKLFFGRRPLVVVATAIVVVAALCRSHRRTTAIGRPFVLFCLFFPSLFPLFSFFGEKEPAATLAACKSRAHGHCPWSRPCRQLSCVRPTPLCSWPSHALADLRPAKKPQNFF
ncbi:hypothetical protein TW95_gp0001 [Pandoravirus inopinatum]|uniref:Uncharacterized protein n=1 Tax=Pandoravirus inopinatum TaxID=1605721 RepID=A0A0B5J547_9VIRU|nr:hypothetical protein TW95_gp0001 [Pandoravirus inopinatum]AJF96735.1 hypothetical protein [Pandoravirus inopinatum]